MDNDLTYTWISLGAMLVTILVMFTIAWFVSVAIDRITVVDVLWGLGFAIIAIVGFVVSGFGDGATAPRVVLLVLPIGWGLRLAVHNGRRMMGKGEDPRYESMVEESSGSKARVALTKVFVPQAGFMAVVALPVVVGQNNTDTYWPLLGVGIVLWAVGVFFETVGDRQLEQFKADSSNKDEVMDRGLWHYTRHPNYFGDTCNWWGIWLIAAGSWAGLVTIVGPILMTYTIVRKTGAALTEKTMSDSKPGYKDYVERTSGFFPMPPKRARS